MELFHERLKRLNLYEKSFSELLDIIEEKDREIERLKIDAERYRKLRRMHCNEFQNIYVASLNGNRSFDELVDGIQTFFGETEREMICPDTLPSHLISRNRTRLF